MRLSTLTLAFMAITLAATTLAQPIALHPDNPNYFLYRGKPLAIVTSAEHYGAVLNLDFGYKTYLATLAAGGMNYTRIFSGVYCEPAGAFNIRHNTLAPAEGRFLAPYARSDQPGYVSGGNKFDLTKWDPAYFDRLRDFIAAADHHGIIVEVTLFCSFYNDRNWSLSPLHPAANINGTTVTDYHQAQVAGSPLLPIQTELVRKIVTELNGFDNIIYEIQNEPWADHGVNSRESNPFAHEAGDDWLSRADLATEASLAWQAKIADAIADAQNALPNKHLIAQNYCNLGFPLRAVDPRVSILNFHYNMPESARWNLGWGRVVGFDESGFAGSQDATYRSQAWRFMMSGGGLFNNLDYSFHVGHEDGHGPNEAPGGGSAALRAQLAVLSRFLHAFDFTRMQPDDRVVTLAPGCMAYTLAEPGKQYALYVEGRGPTELTLRLPAGNYRAAWVNVLDGTAITQSELRTDGSPVKLTSPPFDRDIALRIVAAP